MKLTPTKVGPMPHPSRSELALLDWLRGTLERARSAQSTAQLTVRFGARHLAIRASSAGTLAVHTAGLYAVGNHSLATGPDNRASLFIATPDEFGQLPNLEGLTFGPYGAILSDTGAIMRVPNDAKDSWLTTINFATRTVLALEVSSRSAIFLMGKPLAPREIAEIARPLLHWLAILDGNVVVHAGAVAHGEQGLLVVGGGNSGKTTFVAMCMESGMTFLGDNVIEVSSVGSSTAPRLHGAYASLKIRPNSPLRLTNRIRSTAWDHEARKTVHLLQASPESSLPVTTWLKAAVVVGPISPVVPTPISKSEAYFAIAPNTVAQFPYFEREVLKRVPGVLRRAQTYCIGHSDAIRIPALAKKMLQ